MRKQKEVKQKNDIVKFIENCIKVDNPYGDRKHIKLDYIHKKILKTFLKKHYLCLLGSRQLGTSTTIKSLITYILRFYNNYNIGVISKNKGFITDVQHILDDLPLHISPNYIIKQEAKIALDNGSNITLVTNPNQHTTFLGQSLQLLIVEDAAFIKNLDIIMLRSKPALDYAHKNAEKAGIPYGTILYSTPNEYDKNNYFQINWEKSKEGKTIYEPIEVYWRRMTRLREDPNWYTNVCNMLNNDKNKIDQELNLKFVRLT